MERKRSGDLPGLFSDEVPNDLGSLWVGYGSAAVSTAYPQRTIVVILEATLQGIRL